MPVRVMSGSGPSGAGRRGRKSRPALSYRRFKEPPIPASLRCAASVTFRGSWDLFRVRSPET